MMNGKEIRETFAALEVKQMQALAIEREIEELKEGLRKVIPPGAARAGICHVLVQRPSTKWMDVANAYLEKWVPRTKHEEAAEIVKNLTETVSYSRFKRERGKS